MSEKATGCVLLADRHHGLTEGVRGLLESAFETVVMVADETSLLEGAARLQPDVAVVDLSLAQGRDLGWLRAAARTAAPASRSSSSASTTSRTCAGWRSTSGADEFVLKRAIVTDLLPAIDRVRGIVPG